MNTNLERFLAPILVTFVLITGFFCNVFLRLDSALRALNTDSTDYLTSTSQGAWMLLLFFLLILALMFLINFTNRSYLLQPLYFSSAASCLIAILGRFVSDITWMFAVLSKPGSTGSFSIMLGQYFAQEWWVYGLFFVLLAIFVCILRKFKTAAVVAKDNSKKAQGFLLLMPLILTSLLLPFVLNTLIFINSQNNTFSPLTCGVGFSFAYALSIISLWVISIALRAQYKLNDKFFMKLSAATGISAALAFCLPFFSLVYANKNIMLRNDIVGWGGMKLFSSSIMDNLPALVPIVLIIAASAIARQYFRKHQFALKDVDETTGSFGTSSWADEAYLKKLGAYGDEGSLFGKDDKGRLLRCPTKNRTIIAAPGGGKSMGIVVPALLTEDRPVFVNDIRGELWAVTAKQRAYGFGRKRKVVAIDPFGILQQAEFKLDKPEDLLQSYTINPFDFISKDKTQRDRDINALISSLVVREGDNNSHWDDNAEILLAGLADFAIKKSQHVPNLSFIHDEYMLRDLQGMTSLLESMSMQDGYAKAAAAQVLKTAPEERGSIYSTTYRQLKWLVDSNMQRTFSATNFDLREFVTGDMDIFIVIPEDQVVFHQRVFRMLFTLVTNLLSQASPSKLPKKDILFILDELGQYGYCKDVERAIEILRARKAVVWSLFQSYGQIKLYKKPDLFTNAKIKQIFEVDDEETMRWIQTLGGKKTVLTKTLSTHTGDSRQKMQAFGGSVSKGDGENVHETGVDLIHLNQIRELANDEQFVFIRGERAIKCKRLLYFEDDHFLGKYDKNPYWNENI